MKSWKENNLVNFKEDEKDHSEKELSNIEKTRRSLKNLGIEYRCVSDWDSAFNPHEESFIFKDKEDTTYTLKYYKSGSSELIIQSKKYNKITISGDVSIYEHIPMDMWGERAVVINVDKPHSKYEHIATVEIQKNNIDYKPYYS